MPHAHTPDHSGAAITMLKVQPFGESSLILTTPATDINGRLADRHSAYHDNLSPPLVWTPVADVDPAEPNWADAQWDAEIVGGQPQLFIINTTDLYAVTGSGVHDVATLPAGGKA